jgi:hypothetical protein
MKTLYTQAGTLNESGMGVWARAMKQVGKIMTDLTNDGFNVHEINALLVSVIANKSNEIVLSNLMNSANLEPDDILKKGDE